VIRLDTQTHDYINNIPIILQRLQYEQILDIQDVDGLAGLISSLCLKYNKTSYLMIIFDYLFSSHYWDYFPLYVNKKYYDIHINNVYITDFVNTPFSSSDNIIEFENEV